VRDNFSAKTVGLLQSRVGHHCSNPECRRSTIGPALEEDRTVNIGVAAHITAASGGGPRYDETLTTEARKSADNGIWLCQVCAKLIDSDAARFTADVIRGWKQKALDRAFKAIATSSSEELAPALSEGDDADREFVGALGLPAEDSVAAVIARALPAAATDVAAFRNAREWPAHAIALNLTLKEDDGQSTVTLDGIAKAIGAADSVSLVSPPGTGKSTTLVQLADRIIARGQFVPLIVPLSEWSDRAESFFDFVNRRNAFAAFRRQHFMQMAYYGRLVLMLDGWNELDPSSRTRAIRDLRALRRDYPQLTIVIGTRRHALPIEGACVEIERLSDNQQLEIARAQRGSEGEALVDQAWRSPGVRELISVPLYLNALLATPPGSPFPRTKEEVLRMFVMTHEQALDTAELLRKELHGFHNDMLVGLASQANRLANTSIPEIGARRVISAVENSLLAAGQLSILPQPTQVIDVLVGSHILVRPAASAGAVMFQHQQFQEWYASYEVERLMVQADDGDPTALRVLREDVLDWPAWEESILFACERLSRNNPEGVMAVGRAIQEALRIDPMLSAEMIYRSALETWPLARSSVMALVDHWHKPGKVDRAVRFMITSGRPEFAERVWPLIASEDNQIHLRTLQAAERFRPTVLGNDFPTKLAGLPDNIRKHVIPEIASRSGYDGMELAADLAKLDPNPEVVVQILQSLQSRQADRHVTEILKSASESVWEKMAREGYPDELADAQLQQRLMEVRKGTASSVSDPLRALGELTSERSGNVDAPERAAEIIRSKDFPINGADRGHAFLRAYEAYPKEVAEALVARIAEGLDIPYNVREYLELATTVEEGPIVDLALSETTPERLRSAASSIVGSNAVGRLMDELFVLNDEYAAKDWRIDEASRQKYYCVRDAILVTRLVSFLKALFERTDTDRPERIRLMADLIKGHGKAVNTEKLMITDNARDQLAGVILGWMHTLLNSPKATRHHMSDVVWAVQRLDNLQFVPKLKQMLDRDLADHARAQEEYLRSPRNPLPPDVSHSYTNLYQGAFAAIGGDEVIALMKEYLPNLRFGVEAARVLAVLWERAHPSGNDRRFFSLHDFSEVRERRKQRQSTADSSPTTDFAEAIFATVRKTTEEAQDDAQRRHALTLAQIGLAIPHGSKRAEIDALMQLPLPYSSKQALLTAAAKAGETLKADLLLVGLQELLEAGRRDTWRLEENRGELMGWIELFAFSDRPGAVFEALDLLPASRVHPWNLRPLLNALGNSSHAGAFNVLEELARRDPRILNEYEWLNAMIRLGTEAVALALLGHVCSGSLAGKHGGIGAWHMADHLAGFVRQFPTFRDELTRRYSGLADGPAQQILERALAEVADELIVLAMIASYAEGRRTFQQGYLSRAIYTVAVGRRPLEDWPGAFQEFSASLRAFRKDLFGQVLARNHQSTLAEACLNYIEELRDEHGRIDDEPRHPDIQTGQPWPMDIAA
jgi:hypothetical protein